LQSLRLRRRQGNLDLKARGKEIQATLPWGLCGTITVVLRGYQHCDNSNRMTAGEALGRVLSSEEEIYRNVAMVWMGAGSAGR